MEHTLALVEKFLSNPILWGIATLVAIALALSGRLSVTAAGWFMGSARESVRPPDSSGSAALVFIVPAAAVAGGMWKPACCAGFQALWESWKSSTFNFSTISAAPHFHSEAGKPAKSAPLRLQARWWYGFLPHQATFGKPRNMHTFTVSCAEPVYVGRMGNGCFWGLPCRCLF